MVPPNLPSMLRGSQSTPWPQPTPLATPPPGTIPHQKPTKPPLNLLSTPPSLGMVSLGSRLHPPSLPFPAVSPQLVSPISGTQRSVCILPPRALLPPIWPPTPTSLTPLCQRRTEWPDTLSYYMRAHSPNCMLVTCCYMRNKAEDTMDGSTLKSRVQRGVACCRW